MTLACGLVLLFAAGIAVLISVGAFLLIIRLLSLVPVLCFLGSGLAVAGLIAWQACRHLFAAVLLSLACICAVSGIAVSTRGSNN